MSVVLDDLLYTRTHEWVRILENGRARIGITDYAQAQLSDVVFFSPVGVGDELGVGDALGDVESIKAVSGIYAPISGTVTAVNDRVADDPALVNAEPYEAWLAELEGVFDLSPLMDADGYRAFLSTEA